MADNQRIEDLRRRVQQDPASIVFAQLAEELRRDGHLQEAADVCRAGLAIHPSYLSARVTLGRALLGLNQLDAAASEMADVLHHAPDNLAALRAMGDILQRRGELPEALAHYQSALAIAKNDSTLEATVADLARRCPAGPPIPEDTRSAPSAAERATESDAPRQRASRTIVALEAFLDAIHVARANPSA